MRRAYQTTSTSACCIGSAAWDRTVKLQRYPRQGDEVVGHVVREGPGGKSANTAAVMASLGIATTLICRLGTDSVGRQIRRAAKGLALLDLRAQPAPTTQRADILVTPDGERTIVTYRHVLLEEIAPTALALAVVARAQVCWMNVRDPARRRAFRSAFEGDFLAIPLDHVVDHIDDQQPWPIVIGSSHDHARPKAAMLRRVGVKACAVTQGARGGVVWTPQDGWRRYRAEHSHKVLDASGAGDAFAAGFLVAMLAGHPAAVAAVTGAKVAAQTVSHWGAWPSLARTASPTRTSIAATP